MRKIAAYIGVILLIVFSTSCENDDECTPATIDITSLEVEYDCMNTPYQMDIDLSEEFTIIRNQTDFDNLVTGSCSPQIDFEVYDLLIGKKGLSNGIESINYDGLVRNCDNGQLSLTVTFVKNATAEAPNLTYHILMPTLEANDIVNVSIVTIN